MMAEFLEDALAQADHDPTVVGTAEEAESRLNNHPFDAVISDIRMPGDSGLDLLERLQSRHPELPVILITAYGDVDQAVRALREGATDFLRKPFEADELLGSLKAALDPAGSGEQPTRPVFASEAMGELLTQASRVADRDEPVLITGESGVGKEIFARYLHYHGGRSEAPMLTVNCSAIPRELLESELFGHERGAFTDASEDREGLFLAADGGSLLLDEIGDMPAPLQAKLLRVIEQGEVKPLGSDEVQPVDVRILAATNQDLDGMVEEGDFREDLFYRLNVHRLDIPPLRDRPEDIPELVDHFRNQLGLDLELSEDVLEELRQAPWPGNVRQLINVLRRLDAITDGTVQQDDLAEVGLASAADGLGGELNFPPEPDLKSALQRRKAAYIEEALDRTGGNRSEAAELLGMNRTTLVETIDRLDIAREGKASRT